MVGKRWSECETEVSGGTRRMREIIVVNKGIKMQQHDFLRRWGVFCRGR